MPRDLTRHAAPPERRTTSTVMSSARPSAPSNDRTSRTIWRARSLGEFARAVRTDATTFLAELLVRGVGALGHAVGIEHEQVASLERDLAPHERRVGHDTEDQAALAQPFHDAAGLGRPRSCCEPQSHGLARIRAREDRKALELEVAGDERGHRERVGRTQYRAMFLNTDPAFTALRTDPRYAALRRRMRLPE
jgi:hypothetical protein